ncbi:hypothetical protein IRT45_01315 [Nocardia sp. BSTN01]|uniref:hypothetical protein n=1 Tax=Nocardia sp. BSTN01 TaxID=2783665 RepID=UPI00188F3578|nr:hypothetical protein [Nocardia sp. BSTN01]MBF4995791.1 hypothetical protein [Nocardia sp. BSTN01]
MSEMWRSVVDAIVYNIEYYPDLGPDAVDGTARALLVQPLWNMTPQEEYEAIQHAVQTHGPITSIPTAHNEAAIRDFLSRVLSRLDEMKPWPEPRFQTVPILRWPEFLNAPLIAIINAPFPYIQDRVGQAFGQPPGERRYYLLMKLGSGVEIGLIWPHNEDQTRTALVALDPRSPTEIIEELLDATTLAPEIITPLQPSGAAAHPAEKPLFATTPLLPEFHGENLPGNTIWPGKQVRYLTDQERPPYRIVFENGLAYDSNMQPLDTRGSATLWSPQGGRAIFVMDAFGNLYWSPWHVLGQFHHSSLLAGAPVAGAGEIGAKEGRIFLISDKSTHYRPRQRFTWQVAESLRSRGVPFTDSQLEIHSDR